MCTIVNCFRFVVYLFDILLMNISCIEFICVYQLTWINISSSRYAEFPIANSALVTLRYKSIVK